MSGIYEYFSARRRRCEELLAARLPPAAKPPARLHAAMREACLGGGKRLRAVLACAAAELCGAQTAAADDASCALEMIHAYSLVHDDLPAMDDDDTRRGRPACHIQFGEAAAILAGSALQALAFATLAESDLPEARKMKMLQILAGAVGSGGMVGGQALEMEGDGGGLTAAELETVQHKKTGALICASVQLGAAAAGCTDEKTLTALTHYGRHLGLAFQVVDDILDHAGRADKTETANSVTVLGAACASEKARALRDQAVAALAGLGGNAQRLREIADFVAQREK